MLWAIWGIYTFPSVFSLFSLIKSVGTKKKHQCCLPACVGACSHDELAHRDVHDATRLAGRVQSEAQRQWWPTLQASIGHAVAVLDESAAFGTDLRVRHVENLLLEIFNLVCDTSTAALKRPSQSGRRTSSAAAAVLLAEWRARAPAMAAAAAGAAGGAAGCAAVVVTCSSCPSIVSPTPHMHAQHAHARVHVHARCTYTCTHLQSYGRFWPCCEESAQYITVTLPSHYR